MTSTLSTGILRALQRARHALALRDQLPIQDVIMTLFPRPMFVRGPELACRCWNHAPDLHPSCLVNREKQVFYCHSCRHGGDQFTVIRDALDCSFAEALAWARRHAGRLTTARVRKTPGRPFRVRGSARPQIRAKIGTRRLYNFEDANGHLLYQKVRTPTKQFFYRRPAGDGTWVWGLGDVRRVLYGLPLLREIDWTFVVEGEKDVETLWGIGLPATTNPEGAGRWRDAYSLQLKSAGVRLVFIIPDNDTAGRLHARQVRRSCEAHGIRAHLVTLPGLPPKGDVSDYVDQGHTRRDVLRLALKAGDAR